MCAPHGVRMLLQTATWHGWNLTKLDLKSGFVQTGATEHDVYLILPVEANKYEKALWLLLTAAYGLVKEIAKVQVRAYDAQYSLRF